MAIEEIPKSYKYVCDCCGTEHIQHNANGHYTDSRPPHWARLTFAQDAEDYSGAAVADGSVRLLLCPKCRDLARKAINAIRPAPLSTHPHTAGERK